MAKNQKCPNCLTGVIIDPGSKFGGCSNGCGERVWVESDRRAWGVGTIVGVSESYPETHVKVSLDGWNTFTFARKICTEVGF